MALHEFCLLKFKIKKGEGNQKEEWQCNFFPHENTQQTQFNEFCLISKVIVKEKGQGDNSHLFCYERNGNICQLRCCKRMHTADADTGDCSPCLNQSSNLIYEVLGCCLVVKCKSSCSPAIITGQLSLQQTMILSISQFTYLHYTQISFHKASVPPCHRCKLLGSCNIRYRFCNSYTD